MSDAKPRRTLPAGWPGIESWSNHVPWLSKKQQSNRMHTCYFSHLWFELRKAWSAPRMSPTKQKIVKPTGWMIINENIVFNASTCIIQYWKIKDYTINFHLWNQVLITKWLQPHGIYCHVMLQDFPQHSKIRNTSRIPTFGRLRFPSCSLALSLWLRCNSCIGRGSTTGNFGRRGFKRLLGQPFLEILLLQPAPRKVAWLMLQCHVAINHQG